MNFQQSKQKWQALQRAARYSNNAAN